MSKLEFNLKKAVDAARKKKAKLILLQFPEGLKTKIVKIAKEIEKKTNAKTLTLLDPCYGACDIPLQEIEILGTDLAIHFGHTKMLNAKDIVYVPLFYNIKKTPLEKLVLKLARKIKKAGFKNLGIVATVQYLKHLKLVKALLEKNGFKVFIGKSHLMERGQVLGCNTKAAEAIAKKTDCFVFVGDGLFHPIGVAVKTKKPVLLLNPLSKSIGEIPEKEVERFERAHIARIEIAKNAKSFGLLVSTKPGQFGLKKALELKELVEKKGKNALILTADEIRQEYLLGLDLDCFVNTACPRLALDDSIHWKKPLISAEEMEKALK